MKKLIIVSFVFVVSIFTINAQNALDFTLPEQRFNTGKELYDLGKYAPAQRYFEDYLKVANPTEAGVIQEAKYYIAAIEYYLRTVNAEDELSYFLDLYPYSPFVDHVKFMLANLLIERGKEVKALGYLKEIKENNLKPHDRAEKLFIEGYAYLQTQDYENASATFKRLREMDTRYNMAADYYYGYTAYIQGNFDEALPFFLELEDVSEYKNVIPFYLIQIYYQKGENNQVLRRADQLLANSADSPNNAEIYRIVGEIAYKERDFSKAIASLKKYETLSPEILRNDIYLIGLSYYELKNYSNAIQYLSRVTTKPDEITENAYLHIGNSYVELKDKTNARLAYEAALDTKFDSSVREMALYNYALTTYETNSAFGESVSAFEKFLTEFPNSKYADNVYDYLASVYMTSQNYKAAYESIKNVKKPSNQLLTAQQYVLNQLGIEEFTKKNYSVAAEYFTKALVKTPNKDYQADSYIWRGEANYRLGKYQNTLADLNKFFEMGGSKNNNFKNANYLAGYSHFSLKEYRKALEYFQKYERQTNAEDLTYADAMNRIGDCYFNDRNFNEAVKSYNKSITVSPAFGDYPLFQIAYVNGLQKKYSAKITVLERLISEYPSSQYADNALYEIGRAYLMMENGDKAIASYKRLLDIYPNSTLAPKTALEIGMVYTNKKDLNNAIPAYKYVVEKYPGSEESRTALRSLESAYIDNNNVASYVEYAKSLDNVIQTNISSREDSITFIAVERQYMNKNYPSAISGFTDYLTKYCEGGQYCTAARYYLADSYYQTKDKDNALTEFEKLTEIAGNKYMEESILRSAEISYDKKQFDKSLNYFGRLEEIATSTENKNIGKLGVLRSSYFLDNHERTIKIANEIIEDSQTNAETKLEALYNRAKAYIGTNQEQYAIADLTLLAENTKTRNGAESKYLIAQIYYDEGNLEKAETEVLDFVQKNTTTQNQYWLAKSFIVLSDIYIRRGDDFQAKQYLLSLQKNYTEQNDIQEMIATRLAEISEREQKNIIN